MDLSAGHSPVGGGRLCGSNIGSDAAMLRDLKAVFWLVARRQSATPTGGQNPLRVSYRYIIRAIVGLARHHIIMTTCNGALVTRLSPARYAAPGGSRRMHRGQHDAENSTARKTVRRREQYCTKDSTTQRTVLHGRQYDAENSTAQRTIQRRGVTTQDTKPMPPLHVAVCNW